MTEPPSGQRGPGRHGQSDRSLERRYHIGRHNPGRLLALGFAIGVEAGRACQPENSEVIYDLARAFAARGEREHALCAVAAARLAGYGDEGALEAVVVSLRRICTRITATHHFKPG